MGGFPGLVERKPRRSQEKQCFEEKSVYGRVGSGFVDDDFEDLTDNGVESAAQRRHGGAR